MTEASAIESLVNLFSSSLTTADTPFIHQNEITFHEISRMDMTKLREDISFSLAALSAFQPGNNASTTSFSLPLQLLSDLNITTDGLNVHVSASSYAPASSGLLILSPVVGLTLSLPKSNDPITVQGLSEAINISIPFETISEDAWDNFRQQVQCMYWDSENKVYSTDGVQVLNVTESNVVCQSSHLTEFVLAQNLSTKTTSTVSSAASSIPSPTQASFLIFSFEGMLQVVGSRSAAMAMARMPWQPVTISLAQSNQALASALRSAGGFGVPCTASVPFLALPGLVLSMVRGTVYPRDYAMAVEISRPAVLDVQNRTLVSAVTKFSTVQVESTEPVQVEIAGFALLQNRRSTACTNGTEWRYHWLGGADYVACACAANTACKDETVCVGAPSSGDRWAVAAVPTGLCTTPTRTTAEADQSLALGLGLGLGLGLPLAALLVYASFFFSRKRKVGLRDFQISPQNEQSSDPLAQRFSTRRSQAGTAIV